MNPKKVLFFNAKREAGIIIPPNNSKVIYEAIEKLIKDKTLYQTLRKNGRALAEEFQVGKNIDKFLEIYNKLIYPKNL